MAWGVFIRYSSLFKCIHKEKNHVLRVMTEAEIERLVQELVSRLDWGAVENWKTKDFENLREQIREVTGVYLSVTTLKRLLGKVNYEGQPTLATLDAVAVFLGHDGFRAFQQSHRVTKPPGENVAVRRWALTGRSKIVIILTIAIVSVIIVLSFLDTPGSKVDPNLVDFSIEKVAKGIPNTVIFRYDVSKVNAQEVEIQQNWDPTKRHKVDPQRNVFTHYYDYPGYYNAKLLVNGEIIHRRHLYIPSDGWLAALSYPEDPPRYLLDAEWTSTDQLAVGERISDLISISEEEIVLNYYYAVDEPTSDFRNFRLDTELQFNLRSGQYPCEYQRIVILGTEMSMRIPLIYEGCVSQLNIRLGSEFIDGTTTDLTGFGLKQQARVRLEVVNTDNLLTIAVDGQELLSHQLRDDFGELAGIHYAFHGAGQVHALNLLTPSDTLVAF